MDWLDSAAGAAEGFACYRREPNTSMRVAIDGRDVVVRQSLLAVQQTHFWRAQANQSISSSHPNVLLSILENGYDTVVRQRNRHVDCGVLPVRNQKQPFAQRANPHRS